jgi:hypothetical protein
MSMQTPGRPSAALRSVLFPILALGALEASADVGNAVTVASGLANPRGLNFAPNGDLYVALSGSGGTGNCTYSPPNPAVPRCYGETGSIIRILPQGGFETVMSGLPSLVQPSGLVEGGPVDVSFLGTAPTVTISWGGDPALRAALGPKGYMFGSVLHATPGGAYKVVADVSRHEQVANPVPPSVDSNPYATLVQPGRRIVADAGANALVEVRPNGTTRTFALPGFLPNVPPIPGPREPVPTSVVEGPDGALYVGLLTAFPFWRGTAQVLRISSDGSDIQTHVGGLTAVVDLAFDAGGALYILEVASGHTGPFPPAPGLGVGRLLRMCPGAVAPAVLLSGLFFPAGVAIGPDGAAYLSNRGVTQIGEVLRLPVTPCN